MCPSKAHVCDDLYIIYRLFILRNTSTCIIYVWIDFFSSKSLRTHVYIIILDNMLSLVYLIDMRIATSVAFVSILI